jgi:uncharacterized protein YfkK (UPF0435 family)
MLLALVFIIPSPPYFPDIFMNFQVKRPDGFQFVLLTFHSDHEKMKHITHERMNSVNLSEKSIENVEFMIEKMKEKLKVLNFGAIKPSHFDEEMYEELRDIYEMVMKKDSFSISEMQAIVEELGSLRKK